MPGATTTNPSGLSRSLAIFAISFEVPMPTDPAMPPVTSRIRVLSSRASALTDVTERSGRSAATRSTNASSSDSGSTSGLTERRTSITALLVSR
jgi:hypothetical protein